MGCARSAPLHAGGQRQRDRDEGADSDGDAPGAVDEVLDHSESSGLVTKMKPRYGVQPEPMWPVVSATTGPLVLGTGTHQYHRPIRTALDLSARTGRQDTV